MRYPVLIALIILISVGCLHESYAQEAIIETLERGDTPLEIGTNNYPTFVDSLEKDNQKRIQEFGKKPWQPNSTKALLWAILPGGGQIYNRKYWKLPIVWGALMSCYYAITWNDKLYQDYHAAYRDINSADPATNTAWLAFAPSGAKAEDYAQYSYLSDNLKRGNDYYRRYRDLSIVLAVGVYALSMLDAYVDAELFTFDISPDLSMRVAPSLMQTSPYKAGYGVGLGCNITF